MISFSVFKGGSVAFPFLVGWGYCTYRRGLSFCEGSKPVLGCFWLEEAVSLS
jgi:hypothetical protein